MDDKRDQTMTANGLNVLAGIWLIIAPFILGYISNTPKTNDVWLGIIVGVIALINIFTSFRATWLSWINVLAGVWLIIAPFVLNYANNAPRWNDVILGVIVIALSVWGSGLNLANPRQAAHV